MKMKEKIYIKDIKEDKETLKKLFKDNESLKNLCYEQCSSDYYDMQEEEEGNLMFGNNWYKYIDIKDYYSSFYLRLINYHEFYKNLDKDYLCNVGLELYNKISKKWDERDNLDSFDEDYQEKYDDLEIEIEDMCKELLKICEKQLHEYENVDYEIVEEWFINMVQDNDYFEELYFYNNEENYTLYEDISYTKNWN